MLQQVLRRFGNLSLNIMDFPDVDDRLPMHNHDEDTVHITIVARGSLRVHGDGWEMIAKAGEIIDWEPGKRHEFVALEPNSRCVNIPKNMLSSAPVPYPNDGKMYMWDEATLSWVLVEQP